MINKTTLAAIIAAVSITPAMATITDADRKTTTSKGYVDTQVGTRQAKIPAANTNSGTPGTSVVMYTNTEGTIGERGIYSGGEYSASVSNNLVTASALNSSLNSIPEITTSKLTCANNPDCTLWTIDDQTVYGETPSGN